jgi:hypothetical protein
MVVWWVGVNDGMDGWMRSRLDEARDFLPRCRGPWNLERAEKHAKGSADSRLPRWDFHTNDTIILASWLAQMLRRFLPSGEAHRV